MDKFIHIRQEMKRRREGGTINGNMM